MKREKEKVEKKSVNILNNQQKNIKLNNKLVEVVECVQNSTYKIHLSK